MMRLNGRVTGTRETVAVFAQLPGLIRQAAQAGMTDALQYLSRVVRDDFLQGPYPTEIERRRGSFRATFQRGHADNIFIVTPSATRITGTYGSQDKRAHILNDGGTIRSTRPGGYLAIRTEFTKTPRGVVREKYRQPLRNLPNTFVAKGTVFERRGKRIIPIAWLRKSVFIPGRHFLEKGVTKAEPGIQARFAARLAALVERTNQALQRLGGR